MDKSELVNGLQEVIRQWEALLAEVGPARMDQPGVNGDWSMKDMIAHHTVWNRRFVAGLQAAQRREPEPLPPWPADVQSEHEINAWIYASHRERSVQDVLDDMRRNFQDLLAAVGALPDDVRIERSEQGRPLVWVGGKRFPAGEFFDHYHDEHEADVRAWLARESGNAK